MTVSLSICQVFRPEHVEDRMMDDGRWIPHKRVFAMITRISFLLIIAYVESAPWGSSHLVREPFMGIQLGKNIQRTSALRVLTVRGGTVQEEEDTEVEDDSEEEESEDEDEEEDLSSSILQQSALSEPVAILCQTNLQNPLIDQRVELLTVPRSRSISQIKESCRKQLSVPVQGITIAYQGRILPNEMIVDELLDDDEDEEEDENDYQLVLTLDMIPPVEKDWVTVLQNQMGDMTNSELLDAYCTNEAALFQNGLLLTQPDDEENEADSDAEEDEEQSVKETARPLIVPQIRSDAKGRRNDLESTILSDTVSRQLLSVSHAPRSAPKVQVRGDRVRTTRGTATPSWRSSLQRQLNVEWSSAFRSIMLFCFFGYFGGKTPTSRAILLLGAPGVLVLQARAVKLWIRTILHAALHHPPGLFLSLLPAPQQAILSLNVAKELEILYEDARVAAAVDEEDDSIPIDDFVDMAHQLIDDDDDDDDEEVSDEYDEEYDFSDEEEE